MRPRTFSLRLVYPLSSSVCTVSPLIGSLKPFEEYNVHTHTRTRTTAAARKRKKDAKRSVGNGRINKAAKQLHLLPLSLLFFPLHIVSSSSSSISDSSSSAFLVWSRCCKPEWTLTECNHRQERPPMTYSVASFLASPGIRQQEFVVCDSVKHGRGTCILFQRMMIVFIFAGAGACAGFRPGAE